MKLLLFVSIVIVSKNTFAVEQAKVTTPVESLLPMLFGLVAILGVIFVLAFLFKKFSNFGLTSKNIKVVETQMLGNKEKLMIVEVQQQQFLIGVTSHNISQLGELNGSSCEQQESNQKENQQQEVKKAASVQIHPHAQNTFSQIISRLINPAVQPLFASKNSADPRENRS